MSPSLQVTRVQASPVQRLPAEILCIVFDHVSFNDPLLEGLVKATQVSKIWRDAAFEYHLIWSDITIRLGLNTQNLLVSAFFEHSGDVPINITIYASRHFGEMEVPLEQHAHRIRSLDVRVNANLNVGSTSVANALWMQLGTNMPMPRLEAFEILISDSSYISIKRKIATYSDENIIPPVSDGLALWNNWRPTGLTELRLSNLFNQPDLKELYDALSATSATLQHFEFQGLIGSPDDEGVTTERIHLEFPELRSLAVHCNDGMVPLLRLMIIPTLDSLSIRDFITYPATNIPDVEEDEFSFDPVGLFLVIKQWTSITNLEIYGLDLSPDDTPPLPEMLNYLTALNQLSSLVLYGIGVATSIAHTLFLHKGPLLPNLSRFLVGISELTANNSDDLCDYFITRRRHQFPRLQRLSINLDYFRHIRNLNRMGILWEGSDDIFVFENPEVNRFIPIEEINLLEIQIY